MASYTSLLGLVLPVQGEYPGTWGDVANNYLTTYLDAAIAGTQTLSSDADVTLSKTTGASLSGTSSQYALLLCTGARTTTRYVSVPNASKIYIVNNSTTGGFPTVVRGVTGPTTGVSIPAGQQAVIAWNGSDFSIVVSSGDRVVAVADATSITVNSDLTDMATQANTQAAGTLTINAPTGTLYNGKKLIIRLLCTNNQTFSWNAVFQGSNDIALPTVATGGGKYDYVGFIYNSTAAKWQLVARAFGF